MAVTSSIGTTESCRHVRAGTTSRPTPFGGRVLNESSYKFVRNTLKRASRSRLLRSKSKAMCTTHGLQTIRDMFPNREILLACGCRRNCHNRKPEETSAFDAAHAEHQTRRKVLGHSKPTAGGYVRTFEENVEEIAA
jgi:hypothetical protein